MKWPLGSDGLGLLVNMSRSADVMCLAKGLTGGYLAMSATIATKIWNAFLGSGLKTFYHGHTCAAILWLQPPWHSGYFPRRSNSGKRRNEATSCVKLWRRVSHHPLVGNIRQRGLIAAIELVRQSDQGSTQRHLRHWIQVCQAALDKEVWLRPSETHLSSCHHSVLITATTANRRCS